MNPRRLIYNEWSRDPKGSPLTHKYQPTGLRTPNLQLWGHDYEDFRWIKRLPVVNVMTVWSISMLREFNESYGDIENRLQDLEGDLWQSSVIEPWPLLELQKKTEPKDEGSSNSDEDEGSAGLSGVHECIIGTDLPQKLEEFLPKEFYPEILKVQNADNCASGNQGRDDW